MMAQKLMSENKDNPFNSRFFQPSDAMVAPTRQGFSNLLSRMEQKDKQGTDVFPALAIGSGFAPSAGISDVLGFAPDPFNPGQTLPSFSENIYQGRFLDAGLQTLGAGGDVMLAAAPFAPVLFAPAAAMKATSQLGKALRGGSRATKTVDDVKPGDIAKVVPPTDKSDGIFAFHGSAADFDEFKLSKIGTGEGNQAFGYGLYFTDSEDIAKFYRQALSREVDVDGKAFIRDGKIVKDFEDKDIIDQLWPYGGDVEKAIKNVESYLEELLQTKARKELQLGQKLIKTSLGNRAIEKAELELKDLKKLRGKVKVRENTGKTYKVNIKAVMDDLIDYDKPLKDQNEKIKKILKPFYERFGVAETADFGTLEASIPFKQMSKSMFSEALADRGIKGIKYKAGQLSGITDSKATNYVIFDDKIIDIMAKYGIVGAIGVSAMQRGSGSTEGDILPPGET